MTIATTVTRKTIRKKKSVDTKDTAQQTETVAKPTTKKFPSSSTVQKDFRKSKLNMNVPETKQNSKKNTSEEETTTTEESTATEAKNSSGGSKKSVRSMNNNSNNSKIGWRDAATANSKKSMLCRNKSADSIVKSVPKVSKMNDKNKKGQNKFIGQITDIDSLLSHGDDSSVTFDEMERQLAVDSKARKPAVDGSSFIGKCVDIDEVLGAVVGQTQVSEMCRPFEFSRSSTVILKSERGKMTVSNNCSSDSSDESSDGGRKVGGFIQKSKSVTSNGIHGLQSKLKPVADMEYSEKKSQLSSRVHTIIENLRNSKGKELRQELCSLKQIFLNEKDVVLEFVQNNGLNNLIQVSSDADLNCQNYILRTLGQLMLYVDGMNGIINHPETVQWLYFLMSSKSRGIIKIAVRLLLVFVEYTETNCRLLVKSVSSYDTSQGIKPWLNIINLLGEKDAPDMELLVLVTTLINKTLNGIPDQDTYYNVVDCLEEQGMERIIQRYMSKPGTDLDLLRQFHIYEAVLKYEDGEDDGRLLQADAQIRQIPRSRKTNDYERRKSWRHNSSVSNAPVHRIRPGSQAEDTKTNTSQKNSVTHLNGLGNNNNEDLNGVTPGLRRRRERQEKEQKELAQGKVEPRQRLTSDKTNKLGNFSGIVSKAKEDLHNQRTWGEDDSKSSPGTPMSPPSFTGELKKENELQWEQLLAKNMNKPLYITDLDFTDLVADDDVNIFGIGTMAKTSAMNGPPPPPVMMNGSAHFPIPPAPPSGAPPPPPPLGCGHVPPPPPPTLVPRPVPAPSPSTNSVSSGIPVATSTSKNIKKNKKTIKLFWKDVRADPLVQQHIKRTIWEELKATNVDVQKLEHLFENRAKDMMTKERYPELNKNKEVIVLDPKRSNAINIGMTKLPPPRTIKTAILKMDNSIMNREGIEKILNTMMPTEEEKSRIAEAQVANPDIPLGSAEQFLMTLASISELPARLKLWAFKLDYEQMEQDVAEPLMDLKQCIAQLHSNRTFRYILSTLLSIGNFLNGVEAKGFQIDYLAKVPEVKDTVYKHSLLHHLCEMVMEKYPDSTDLYSEIGSATRASKVDFDELAANLLKMECECKASWDRLKLIAKHDGSSSVKVIKLSEFLADCAERIIVLGIIHRRVLNRFYRLLCFLGVPCIVAKETKVNQFLKIISEFALEYCTTRERILQQIEKKSIHRERSKTRGRMITDVDRYKSKDAIADEELRQLLGSGLSDTEELSLGVKGRRQSIGKNSLQRRFSLMGDESLTDGDDEILDYAVRAAAKSSARVTPRERKRSRQAERKSSLL